MEITVEPVCDYIAQITYSMERLAANHDRGNISIARRNVPVYKIANPAVDVVEEEFTAPPRCPPKEPPPKPADPCEVAPSGLAAL